MRTANVVIAGTIGVLAALGAVAQDGGGGAAPPVTGCITCHVELVEDLGPQVPEWKESVHAAVGISCHDCHGGKPDTDDMIAAKRAETGFLGKTKSRDEIAPRCARCHSDIEFMRRFNPAIRVDQMVEYLTSRHGKAVHQEASKTAATCTDCHGGHAILKVSDPRAPVYPTHVADTCGKCHSSAEKLGRADIPTDVLDRWRSGVHGQKLAGGDLSAPTCNDCHGNHGAVPPGTRDVVHVCGRCHVTQEEHFEAGTHRAHFEKMDKPACVTCHGNHDVVPATDALLANVAPGVCGQCHQLGDRCDKAAVAMVSSIDGLTAGMTETEQLLAEAELLGMDVSEARFRLTDVRDRLTMARVVVHRFSEPDFAEVIDQGDKILDEIRKEGDAALDEWQFRRQGLAIALVLILVVIVLLAIKVRSLDRARERQASPRGAATEQKLHIAARR